jgi:hypothetical protein
MRNQDHDHYDLQDVLDADEEDDHPPPLMMDPGSSLLADGGFPVLVEGLPVQLAPGYVAIAEVAVITSHPFQESSSMRANQPLRVSSISGPDSGALASGGLASGGSTLGGFTSGGPVSRGPASGGLVSSGSTSGGFTSGGPVSRGPASGGLGSGGLGSRRPVSRWTPSGGLSSKASIPRGPSSRGPSPSNESQVSSLSGNGECSNLNQSAFSRGLSIASERLTREPGPSSRPPLPNNRSSPYNTSLRTGLNDDELIAWSNGSRSASPSPHLDISETSRRTRDISNMIQNGQSQLDRDTIKQDQLVQRQMVIIM